MGQIIPIGRHDDLMNHQRIIGLLLINIGVHAQRIRQFPLPSRLGKLNFLWLIQNVVRVACERSSKHV